MLVVERRVHDRLRIIGGDTESGQVVHVAMSQAADRLERLGLIERRVGVGRAVALHPTDAGRAASADGVERELASERRIRTALGAQRYDALVALLTEARDALRAR